MHTVWEIGIWWISEAPRSLRHRQQSKKSQNPMPPGWRGKLRRLVLSVKLGWHLLGLNIFFDFLGNFVERIGESYMILPVRSGFQTSESCLAQFVSLGETTKEFRSLFCCLHHVQRCLFGSGGGVLRSKSRPTAATAAKMDSCDFGFLARIENT